MTPAQPFLKRIFGFLSRATVLLAGAPLPLSHFANNFQFCRKCVDLGLFSFGVSLENNIDNSARLAAMDCCALSHAGRITLGDAGGG